MNGRQRYIIFSGFQSLLLQDGPDGLFPIADPPLLQNTLTQGRFGGCHHVDAHVGAPEVVEVNGFGYGITHLGYVREAFALEQFILHRIVDALSLSVLLGVAGLSHADLDMVLLQEMHILAAGVLNAAV